MKHFESILPNLLAFLALFFAPIVPAVIASGIIIGVDTAIGIYASKKNKVAFESRKFERVLTKFLLFNMLLISAHVIERYMIDFIPFVKITLSFIAISEFTSISEKVEKITGKGLLKYVKEQISKKVEGNN